MALADLLDKTCTHERATAVADSVGGNTPTWATQTAGVPVALWPAGTSLARSFLRRDIVGTHVVCTDRDLSVKAKDRLTIDGVKYRVEGFELYHNASFSSTTLYLVDCTRLTV